MEAPARPDAAAPVAEDQLAALREEIRRAGKRSHKVRNLWLAFLFPGWLVIGAILRVVLGEWAASGVRLGLILLLTATAALVCHQLANRLRQRSRGRLRQRLLDLPHDQASQLLASLGSEDFESRGELLRPLLRDLSLPTELTPAGTPEGSGAEVSARP